MGSGALRTGLILEYEDSAFQMIHMLSLDTMETAGEWSFQDNVGESGCFFILLPNSPTNLPPPPPGLCIKLYDL